MGSAVNDASSQKTARASVGTAADAATTSRTPILAFVLAIVLPLVALVLTLALSPVMSGVLFLFFFAAVAVTAFVGGFAPGLAATAVSLALINYYLLEPAQVWTPSNPTDLVRLGMFVGLASLMSRFSGSLRDAREQAERSAREAVGLAEQLREQAVELEQQMEEAQALALELEQANNETREALDTAEAASRAKSAFLTTMSHELRTPLNAIAGYVELIDMELRGPVTPAQRADLERIRRSQQHLLALINDILNLVRIESGQVRLELADVPLADATERVADLIALQAERKGVVFEKTTCDPRANVRADADKLQQVLLNLLTNAVKFTPSGGRIRLECEGGERIGHLRVRDTGIGIPSDKLEHVFEPFVQLNRTLSSNTDGVGLGLSISRNLARAMGGDITVVSTPGSGSTFTVTLPRADRSTPANVAAQPQLGTSPSPAIPDA
jgi:signal transduction histidine kinase